MPNYVYLYIVVYVLGCALDPVHGGWDGRGGSAQERALQALAQLPSIHLQLPGRRDLS